MERKSSLMNTYVGHKGANFPSWVPVGSQITKHIDMRESMHRKGVCDNAQYIHRELYPGIAFPF